MRGFRVRCGQHVEQGRVHLRPRLQRIAAVDEERGVVVEHDRCARGAGEAGEPGKPFRWRGQELVLVLVAMRDQEALELARFQHAPEALEPLFAGAGG
jgi:hypothetical protein